MSREILLPSGRQRAIKPGEMIVFPVPSGFIVWMPSPQNAIFPFAPGKAASADDAATINATRKAPTTAVPIRAPMAPLPSDRMQTEAYAVRGRRASVERPAATAYSSNRLNAAFQSRNPLRALESRIVPSQTRR